MSAAFGVHVGNTSACLAVQREGRCDVVANDAGDRVTPAVVGWNGGEILVGLAAKQLGARLPASAIHGIKGVIGKQSEAPGSQTIGAKPVLDDKGKVIFEVDDDGKTVRVSSEKALKEVFKYMHDIALSHSTVDVEGHNTVITVPLEFTKEQRQIAVEAAEAAGFKVVQVISEPAAACLAYNLGQLDPLESFKCLIYRCGGKSLSVSVVQIQSGLVQVIKSVTRNDIGGDRVTHLLSGFLADEFIRKYKADPRETKRGRQKLLTNAENVKHILSTLETANCYIESLYEGIDFNFNVTRARFDNELAKILPELTDPIKDVLEAAKLSATDIDKVILCGGTSKIPRLQKNIFGLFPKSETLTTINTDEVIATGAASQASLLDDKLKFGGLDGETTGSVEIPAIGHSIVYQMGEASSETEVLIPVGCPIPVRRSNHLTLATDLTQLHVKIFLRHETNASLTQIAEFSLNELTSDSRVSLSAHVHRDGSLHLALTDKTSGHADQVTLHAGSA